MVKLRTKILYMISAVNLKDSLGTNSYGHVEWRDLLFLYSMDCCWNKGASSYNLWLICVTLKSRHQLYKCPPGILEKISICESPRWYSYSGATRNRFRESHCKVSNISEFLLTGLTTDRSMTPWKNSWNQFSLSTQVLVIQFVDHSF